MFVHQSMMVLFWVGNCIFYAEEYLNIDDVISSIISCFLLERELDAAGFFWGLKIEGYKTLKEGSAVSFEPGDGEKGPVAKNIVNA